VSAKGNKCTIIGAGARAIRQRDIFLFSIMTLGPQSDSVREPATNAANMRYAGVPADFLVAPAQQG
jgi:hypothetical protein